MPKFVLIVLAFFLTSNMHGQGHPILEQIKLIVGNQNYKKLDVNKMRFYFNKKDSIVIIPLLEKNIEREFLITDLKATEKCFWIRLESQTSQSSYNENNSKVYVSSANYSEKKILHIDSKAIVFKEELFSGNKHEMTMFYPNTPNAKFLDINLAPFKTKIYFSPTEELSLINLEWILTLSYTPSNHHINSSTFVNRFISLKETQNKIIEIEFDKSK